MIISPQYVQFESANDVIDYVTKGLPPTKDDFDNLIKKVKLPDDWQGYVEKKGKEVTISENVFKDWTTESVDVLCSTLERVYRNRVINRNISCCIIGAAVAAGIIIAVKS